MNEFFRGFVHGFLTWYELGEIFSIFFLASVIAVTFYGFVLGLVTILERGK